MIIGIDPDSHIPPYEQIRSQISTMAASGILEKGSRLPAIRQLASDVGLAGGTVARAYRELEQEGTISTRCPFLPAKQQSRKPLSQVLGLPDSSYQIGVRREIIPESPTRGG